jgi:hypothetical protein
VSVCSGWAARRRERHARGKTDALDAIRAARAVLAQTRPAQPRAGGERELLRALTAAREGAVTAKRAGLCQLRGWYLWGFPVAGGGFDNDVLEAALLATVQLGAPTSSNGERLKRLSAPLGTSRSDARPTAEAKTSRRSALHRRASELA